MPDLQPTAASPWTRRATRALLVLVALVAAAQVVFYFCRTVDDMFISLRYAERWVAGDGLTFNDGQRVEGFSNPSWVALQAVLIALGSDGVIATKVLSLLSYGLLVAGLYRLGREVLALSRPLALVGLLLTAASSYIASWALWGLETPLYLALMVWLVVTLHRRVNAPSRRSLAALVGVTVAFVATRPEAPLYVIASGGAVLLFGPRPTTARAPTSGPAFRARLRALLAPALVAGVVLAGLLLARHAYFGLWLPQTYYAKQGTGLDLARLAPLVGQGATPFEIVYLVGSLGLAAVLAVRARVAALLAIALANLFFVASVAVDWMPNQRHFLPLIVLAPYPWLWALSRLATAALRPGRRALAAAVTVALAAGALAGQGVEAFRLDARFSVYDFKSHGRGERWTRPKTVATWRDALDGLTRTPPAHVAPMNVNAMGMIDQLFRILEASAAPERDSWFLGRDIGRVGYYSPIQVFETAGLFTPALTASAEWVRDRKVDTALIDAAFALNPVVTDLLDDWTTAVARHRDRALVARHDVLVGGPGWVVAMRPRDLVRPSPAEVLARYARVADAFDTPFYQSTLYGESVGAAVAKRYAWIRPQLLANARPAVAATEPLTPAEPVAILGDAVLLHGCTIEPPPEPRPGAVTIACVWEAKRPLREDWTVFVHLVDASGGQRVLADHAPRAGLLPSTRWPVGERLRDAVVVDLPDDARALSLSVRVGLFAGARRAPAATGPSVDAAGRVIGPTFGPGLW